MTYWYGSVNATFEVETAYLPNLNKVPSLACKVIPLRVVSKLTEIAST